jgi:hypothetical protein
MITLNNYFYKLIQIRIIFMPYVFVQECSLQSKAQVKVFKFFLFSMEMDGWSHFKSWKVQWREFYIGT